MFFDKDDIREDGNLEVVDLSVLMKRIKQTVEEKLAYTPDYEYADVVPRKDAEELLFNLYNVLKDK